MKKIKALLVSVYKNPTVRHDVKHLVIVIVGIVLAHYGIKLG